MTDAKPNIVIEIKFAEGTLEVIGKLQLLCDELQKTVEAVNSFGELAKPAMGEEPGAAHEVRVCVECGAREGDGKDGCIESLPPTHKWSNG